MDGPDAKTQGADGTAPKRKNKRRGRRGGRAWRRRKNKSVENAGMAEAQGTDTGVAGLADAGAAGPDDATVKAVSLSDDAPRDTDRATSLRTAGEQPSTTAATNGHDRARGNQRHHGSRRRMRPGDGDVVYAALDLGTNNCRLLVARPTRASFRVVDAFSRVVRLGQGLALTGRLSDAAMDRAVEALAACRDKLVINGVNRHRLIATEACRQAENGQDFLDRVRDKTGLTLEVVTRETEAHLAVAGCASLIDPSATGVVVFDIGGGSTELVVLDFEGMTRSNQFAGAMLRRAVAGWTSMPVGVVGVAERHGGVDVPPEIFAAMVRETADMLDEFPAVRALDKHPRGRVHLLGTSGTVTTIAGVHLGLKRYDRRRVDGTWMGPHSIRTVNHRLMGMSYDERAGNACIGRDRADLVLAGCAIFEAIRLRWPWARVRVADRGLREGILMSLMSEDDAWEGPGNNPAAANTQTGRRS